MKRVNSLSESTESIKYSSIVMIGLVNDLLDLAKQQQMTFELHRSDFNLPELV
jgi:signal transduction histidine kinase